MQTNFKLMAGMLAIAAATLISTGCNTQPAYPNQLNTFDASSYDTLTLTHGALTSLRAQVATTYVKYVPEFNQAAAAYATALNSYTLYRSAATSAGQADVTAAISNLTLSIVTLEDAFEADLNVPASTAVAIRTEAQRIRKAAGPNTTVADVLTALEVAAAIAEAIPGAQPDASLAAMVVAATDAALDAEDAAAGQPIDLTTIQNILPIQ